MECFKKYKTKPVSHQYEYDSEMRTSNTESAMVQITGQVINDFGEPLSDAHIVTAKGEGTVTNDNGEFSLWIDVEDKISISHLGYKPISIFPNITNTNTIQLEQDIEQLEEVVVNANEKKTSAGVWLFAAIVAGVLLFKKGDKATNGLRATKKKNIVKVNI